MNNLKHLFLILLTALAALPAEAQTVDSVDVTDYDIYVDLSQGKPFYGDATLTLQLVRPCNHISLDLLGTVDSLWVNGSFVASPALDSIPTANIPVGTPFTVRVCYHGSGYVEPAPHSFGGFHFDNNINYHLGVGFNTNPHVIGRALMPCRDNYYDKATYTLRIHSKADWTAECSGILQSRDVADDNTELSVWRIAQPVPTYLVGVSQAAWNRINKNVTSLYGTYPLTLGYTTHNSTNVERAFAELDSVVPQYERCFGPYRWERIGYIATPKGSMEHVHNIALHTSFMASLSERAQTTIAHELGHAWFGNLITCSTEEDMWINEGGASFCSEVAMESVSGREASNKYYQTNLESVIRSTHHTDNGYRALSGMPHNYTYGSTTYDKGWMVWHSLRGYLGDSLFYSCVRRLMDSKAFGDIDSYGVRDSLSLYSGVDLTDFFDFHVFHPGFVDYHIDMHCDNGNTTVRIRQQSIGTDAVAQGNRVPVTFFSADGTAVKRMLSFNGSESTQQVDLPFTPTYCVLDRDLEISDAATQAEYIVENYSNRTAAWAHTRLFFGGNAPQGTPVVVEHHWGRPWDIDTATGVRRTAKRYWVVRSPETYLTDVQGQFRYVRSVYIGGSYPYLDYDLNDPVDSLVLLYREAPGKPWVSMSRNYTGNTNEGYFTLNNLRTGEYTLAVVDTNLVGILDAPSGSATMNLFPNPMRRGESLTLEVPTDDTFTLRIFDASGRQKWQKKGLRNGAKVSPRLASGTYLVQIENKFVSLQSKLIVL